MTDLDARHLLCPLPVLKARKRLLAMAPGDTLRVLTTDPAAVVDMPHFCGQAGHQVISSDQADGYRVWVIRRGGM